MSTRESLFKETFRRRAVVSFTLPSTGERWNWPVEGDDGIDAFIEILDRAGIGYVVGRNPKVER